MGTSANKQLAGFTLTGSGNKWQFLCKSSLYAPFKAELGLDHISETGEEGYVTQTQSALIRSGRAMMITVSGRRANKKVAGKLLCPIDKAETAMTNLIGKKYNGWAIEEAYQSGDYNISY